MRELCRCNYTGHSHEGDGADVECGRPATVRVVWEAWAALLARTAEVTYGCDECTIDLERKQPAAIKSMSALP